MNAPLNRDQQIEIMKGSRERHLARFERWIDNHSIREVLTRPAPGQDALPAYERQTKRVSCC